jgi:serine/threonine protein kinase
MAISPGIRLGPYEIRELLGKGGMGEVYLAQDTRLGRKVAVKVLPPESMRNAVLVQRFEQEARAASARNHPNILTIYDFGVADGTYYMAMEYVEGQTLRALMGVTAMPAARALEIAAQCADGLSAAHAAGIIHRDIKPANIMVRPDGYVKILDFGLAKLAEPPFGQSAANTPPDATALTVAGQIMGTCQYMSPEQSRGQELDAGTDIWSLGAVLYEMVSGKSPFAAPTMSDTMASILTREPARLSSIGVFAGEQLDHLLDRALVKERRHRYLSMHDMAIDLKHLRQELELGTAPSSRTVTAIPLAAPTRNPQLEMQPDPQPGPQLGPDSRSARKPTGLTLLWIGLSSLVVAALVVWGIVGHRPTVSAIPERQLSYSLQVQKMRDGKPYQEAFRATGREIFENGWKVQFDFSFPQAGSLYLLNDGPGPDGKDALSLVFPTPSVNQGSAQVMAYTNVQSAWLLLDNHAGREKFWVVWAIHPLPELERARTQMFAAQQAHEDDPQIIRDPQLNQAVPALLAKAPVASATVDPASQQTSLQGHGDVLVSGLELEHE